MQQYCMLLHITVKFKTEPAMLSVIEVINGNEDVWFSVTLCARVPFYRRFQLFLPQR